MSEDRPYSGSTGTRPEEPEAAAAPSTRPEPPPLPGILAGVALGVFAILIPWIALFVVLDSINLLGATFLTDEQKQVNLAWSIVAFVSGVLAVVTAIVAIVLSRSVAPRVVSMFALVLGLGAMTIWGLGASSIAGTLPSAAESPEPPGATCGPDAPPPVFGGDLPRYTPCPVDAGTAQLLLDRVIAELPTGQVTPGQIERYAAQLAEEGASTGDPVTGQAVYEGGEVLIDGSVQAAWVAAPVTCAIVTYRDGLWQGEVVGLYVDGGCMHSAG